MIYWLTLSSCFWASIVLHTQNKMHEQALREYGPWVTFFGETTVLVFSWVPAIYVVGWMLLPALGVGYVGRCAP